MNMKSIPRRGTTCLRPSIGTRFLVLLIFATTAVNTVFAANTYHVIQDGTGDFTTIQACANVMQAGDTCVVHAGIYDERVSFPTQLSGTQQAKITFRAEPRRQVVMKGFFTRNTHYLRIEGFIIHNLVDKFDSTWGAAHGVFINSDFVEVVDNYFYDIPTSAVFVGKEWAIGTKVLHNHMYRCQMGMDASARNTRDSLIEGNNVERLYGWRDTLNLKGLEDNDYIRWGGVNTIIRNNHLHGTRHEEIVYQVRDASGMRIPCVQSGQSNPWCYQGYLVDQGRVDGIELLNYSHGTLENALVENNIIEDAHAGIKTSVGHKPPPVGGVTIRNNLFRNFWGQGVFVFGTPDYRLYNNTFYNTGPWGGFALREFSSDRADSSGTAKNNIFVKAGVRAFTVDDNVWPRFSEQNNLVFDTDQIFDGWSCSLCQADPATAKLFNMDPLFKKVPAAVLYPDQLTSPDQIVLLGFSFDSLIQVGDCLEYIRDGIVRTISAKSIVAGNIVVTYSPGIDDYQRIDEYLQIALNRPFFYLWKTDDFSLDFTVQQGSPVINAGVNLAGIVDFDKAGVSRPQGHGWDIGAYEYTSSEPCLTLTSPNGGEVWRKGEIRTISWTASGVSANLIIELLQDGSAAGVIASSVSASTETFSWTVGRLYNGSFVTGQNLKIRIRTEDGAILAEKEIR